MARHRILIILSVLLCPFCLFGQSRPVMDYSKADTLALHTKYDGDINQLTRQLTNPFSDPTLKARAIFRWLTDNIAYDCKYYNKYGYEGRDPKTYKCNDDDSVGCDLKREAWENSYMNHVLDEKKGVCQAYAMLFKRMCNLAGIDCEFVSGYTRTEDYEVGTAGELDHAWNAVRLNGVYYLVDATWAAGGASKDEDSGKLKKFTKHFDDYYWLTPPEEFARNHFPEEPKWVLIKNYTKDKFSLNPYYEPGVISDIKLLAPTSGIIRTKRGDTLKFKINYTAKVHRLQINTNAFRNPDIWYDNYITKHKYVKVLDTFAMKKQQYIKYKQNGDTYEFAYVVKDYSLDYLEVLFDYQRVMRFKVTYR